MHSSSHPQAQAGARSGPLRWLMSVEHGELPAVAAGFTLFFCIFTGYFMLRPLRETAGITGGVENLQWLFTATFVVMLIAVPIYGAFSARVQRRRFVPWVYAFFATNLLGFAAALQIDPGNIWLARVFYVWLSVFNLFVVSVAWSLMADVFRPAEAKRLFPPIAAGASLGGLTGPLVGVFLVPVIGHGGLAYVAAGLILLSLAGVAALLRWRRRHPPPASSEQGADGETIDNGRAALGGGIFAGLSRIARSPYLLGISAFVVLLASVSTFLYFEQARLVAETFPDRVRQTQVFGVLDTVVQSLTLLTQLFLSGRIAKRYGVMPLLTAVPLVMATGFLLLAAAPVFGVLAVVMVLRRVGEYALIRPGREMLFTRVDAEAKYKAKNVIDTVVYRGADAVSGWLKAGIDALGLGAAAAALGGALLAALWGLMGAWLGRRHDSAAGLLR